MFFAIDELNIEPMNGIPHGDLFYLDIQFNVTPTGVYAISLEEQISYYDYTYESNKNSKLSSDKAVDAIMKSIQYRMKKLIKDYC